MWKIFTVYNFYIVIWQSLWYNLFMDINKYLSLIDGQYFTEFKKFEKLLLEHNKICNLTSICDEKGVRYKHFLDSIAGESLFSYGAKVIEIGSGGGFPSIPLKIIRRDLNFDLVESTGKKCAFLEGVVDKMGFDGVQVRNIRAEDGANDANLREKFDFACARAVARLNVLCEYCLPFVKTGGKFIAYKGGAEEIDEAQNAIKVLGGRLESVTEYQLPENYGKRALIVIKKIKHTPLQYPRGLGRERKFPL